MILLPGGSLRASVWDPETRGTRMREVTEDLPYFLRTVVRLHDEVSLKDLLLLAEAHRDFLLPLFTDLLDEFVEEVKRPAEHEDLCDLDYLEITWEAYHEGKRFDLQPVLVGRNHEDDQVYSVEAVPTYAMGHLPVLLRGDFRIRLDTDSKPDAVPKDRGRGGVPPRLPPLRRVRGRAGGDHVPRRPRRAGSVVAGDRQPRAGAG